MNHSRFYTLLAVIIAVFAALRIVYFMQLLDSPILRLLILDSDYYYRWATRLFQGFGHPKGPFWLGPGYPTVLGAYFKLIGTAATAPIVVLQILLSISSVTLLALFTRKLFGDAPALVTAALAALYAPWIYYDGAILSASLIVFFNAAMLYFLIVHADVMEVLSGALKPSRPWVWLVAGIFCGLSALARPTALIFAVLLIAVLFILHRGRGWLSLALFLAAIVVTQLPISIRNIQNSGSAVFSTSSGGVNFFIGNRHGASGKYDELDFVETFDALHESESYRLEASKRAGKVMTLTEASTYWSDQALEDIFHDPGEWTKTLLRKLWFTIRNEEIANNFSFEGSAVFIPFLKNIPFRWGMILALAVAGFVLYWPVKRKLRIFGIYFVAYVATCLIFFASSEYRFPLILALLPLAGFFLVELWRTMESKQFTKLAIACAVYLLVIVAVSYPSDEMRFIVRPLTDLNNLGTATEVREQYDQALAMYTRALTVDENSKVARSGLADALWAMGNYDLARNEYELAGVTPPDSVSGKPAQDFLRVLEKYESAGDYKSALDLLNEKFPLQKDAPVEIWSARAEIEAKLDHLSEAGVAMMMAGLREPTSPVWPYQAAEYFLDAGNSLAADSLYRESIRRYPAFAPARLELGFLAVEEGDVNLAKEQLAELRKIQIPEDTLRAKVDTLQAEIEKVAQ